MIFTDTNIKYVIAALITLFESEARRGQRAATTTWTQCNMPAPFHYHIQNNYVHAP